MEQAECSWLDIRSCKVLSFFSFLCVSVTMRPVCSTHPSAPGWTAAFPWMECHGGDRTTSCCLNCANCVTLGRCQLCQEIMKICTEIVGEENVCRPSVNQLKNRSPSCMKTLLSSVFAIRTFIPYYLKKNKKWIKKKSFLPSIHKIEHERIDGWMVYSNSHKSNLAQMTTKK